MATLTYEELLRENRWLRGQLAGLEWELEALRAELLHLGDREDDLPPFVKPRRERRQLTSSGF